MKIRFITRMLLVALLAAMLTFAVVACTSEAPDTGNESETLVTSDTRDESVSETATETEADSGSESTPADTVFETEPTSESETTSAETEPEAETNQEGYRPAEEVKVISFNLDANEATIRKRSELLVPLILSFEPDSIGVQEARGGWNSQLNRQLIPKGYTRVGVDAGGNPNGSAQYFATYIFYRTDKYNLIDSGTFWMSKTPDVPSIYDSTVDCNRTCTWALLENKETGFRYVHMNTHLDWMNMEVNKIQVAMIREQIERFEAMGYPVFATGDYNCDEGTTSYNEMLKSDVIADSKHVADKTMNLGTYPSYGQYDVTVEKPIDYVFVTGDMMDVHEYKVIDEKPDGEYVSDHNGLFVHATVKALPIIDEAKTLPLFQENAEIKVEPIDDGTAMVTFPQATSEVGVLASSYRLELVGSDIQPVTVSSGVLTLDTSETVTTALQKLVNAQSYTLRVIPISVFGDEGTPIEISFTFVFSTPDSSVDPEEMAAADIFNLSVEDGKPVDISPNAMPITVLGTPAIEGDDHIFAKNGNYKIPAFKEHYSNLQDGFTLEAYLTVGDDVHTLQAPIANLHAGGTGMEIYDGNIRFGVHIGGSYQWVTCTATANTTYHLVVTYDKENGVLRMYVDGALADTAVVSGNMGLPTASGAEYLCIGADSDATGQGENLFAGSIHEVRIYGTPATDGNALWMWQQIGQ